MKGKILLDFKLQDFPEGIPSDEPALASPPHWRMTDPQGRITCWGYSANGSFESVVAIMRLAQIGAKRATRDELIEAGIIVLPKPDIKIASDIQEAVHGD